MTINLCGELPVVGTVLYSASFPMSVLSQSSIIKQHGLEVSYDQSLDRYTAGNPVIGALLTFLPHCGLYVCDMIQYKDGGAPHHEHSLDHNTIHGNPTTLVTPVEQGSVNTCSQQHSMWSHDRTTKQKAHVRNGSTKPILWTILQLVIVHWILRNVITCIDMVQSPMCNINQTLMCLKNSTVNNSIQGIQLTPQMEPKTGVDMHNEDHVVVELTSVLETVPVRADEFPAPTECLLSDNDPNRIDELPADAKSHMYETREGYPSRSSRMRFTRSYSIAKALDIDYKKLPPRVCSMTNLIPGPSQNSPPDVMSDVKDQPPCEASMYSTMAALEKPTIRHYTATPYIVEDNEGTTLGTALANTSYSCEDDMHGTKTHAMQSFAYMGLGGPSSPISWTPDHLKTCTNPDVKLDDWNEQFNADQEACSSNLPHNTVTDVTAFKRANNAYRMHTILDPYRKRVPLKVVEEDHGSLGTQSIVDFRSLQERALGCSCGSGIDLFWISRIAEVDNQFHTDAIDDQWTYSQYVEDLLQSSWSATISTTLVTATDITLTLAVVRHQLPRPDLAEQLTSLKFRCRAVTTSMSCSNQLWSPVILRCQPLLYVHSDLLNLIWSNQAIGLFRAQPMHAQQVGTSYLQHK